MLPSSEPKPQKLSSIGVQSFETPRKAPFLGPGALLVGVLFLGVLLALAGPGTAQESGPFFSEDVAPIFYGHCVQCHRPDNVAPMSLLTYKESRPWAKSIVKAVQTRDMPPFSGESDKHEWVNDISLSDDQIETITAWVKAGAPEGDPSTVPAQPTFAEGWTLGEPDMILTLQSIEIPADGEDFFPKQTLKVDLDRPRWVKAIEFLPGDRRATHHFQSTYSSPGYVEGDDRTIGRREAVPGNGGSGVFGIWTAGMPPYVFPEGMGRVLTPGTTILMDSHYHPFGEATTDVTQVGIYFGEGELQKEVATVPITNTGIRIPPNHPHHAEEAFFIADADLQVLALSPHMHVRGKAMKYVATYPDGTKETLLDVPNYNYNWQWLYYPAEPISLPEGTRVDVTAVYDNSDENPHNPDPTKEIIYRGDTFNEMMVGFLEVVRDDGVVHEPLKNTDKIAKLLSAHPADDSFLSGGFLPLGFYVPKTGEGMMYIVQGLAMFTISLDDIEWTGDSVEIMAQFPTPEASATTALIKGKVNADGKLQGSMTVGLDLEKPMTLPLMAVPFSALGATSAAGDDD